MSLRIRRGPEADRLTMTPEAGEFIFTTDNQEVWIGNGATVGGIKVTGLPTSSTTSNIPEGSNLYFTAARVISALPSQTNKSGMFLTTNGTSLSWANAAGAGTWGSITGTLSSQTDLQTALNAKVNTTTTITINGTVLDLSANRSWTLDTANVAENGSLYFTNARALAVPLTGLSTATSTAVVAADSVLAAIGKLQAQNTAQDTTISGKQPQLNGTGFVKASGTTISYDNSTYLTTAATTTSITEGTNLYYTDARVRTAALTGVSFATNSAILATDSVLAAFGKLQAQVTSISGGSGANALGTYIVQTATNAPANAQILGSLSTGLMKVTTTTGVISVAAAGTDYLAPSSPLTGLSVATGTAVAAADTILVAIGKLQAQNTAQDTTISGKQPQLNGTGFVKASGTTISYDNSTYLTTAATTTAIAEGTNLYYTDTRVRAAQLTGLSLVTGGAITATDTVLAAFGKLQNQVTSISGSSGANALGTYIVQTATNAPTNAQILASLSTGLVKVTTTTGVLSVAVAGTDYLAPTTPLTGLSVATSTAVVATDTFLVGIGKLQAQNTAQDTTISGKQPQLNGTGFVKASGTTISYDNSTYLTTAATTTSITEGTNLYYTDTRVRAAQLTGLSLVTGGAITATDTVLSAFGKLQNQVTSISGSSGANSLGTYIVQTATNAPTNAQILGSLSTGIMKVTTTTGVISVAVAADFPTLNQSTTGSAATLTTSRNIYGNSFNGSADVTGIITSTYLPTTTLYKDANNNLVINNVLDGYATTPTAAGTTTLTVASAFSQYFTGSTTQTVVMPSATTLTLGQSFWIVNRSTGSLTVNANGGSLLLTQPGGTAVEYTVTNIGTAAGTWDVSTQQSQLNGTGFVKVSGATISYDNSTYLTANQSITLSSEASGTGTTSIAVTLSNAAVIGKLMTGLSTATSTAVVATDSILIAVGKLQAQNTAQDTTISGKQPQLNGTGFVKASGTTISYDNSTYLTANQSITLSTDASGSGTTSIAVTVTGLRGVALPALGATAGLLKYTGTGTNTWVFDTNTYLTSSTTTTNITEGTNLYYTDTRVRSAALTGLSTATSTAVVAADSVLAAIGKLQAQNTAQDTTISGKQPQLNGTGFVKASGTTISYDNSTYLTAITGTGLDSVFTTNTGFLKRTGAGTYTVDTTTYLSSSTTTSSITEGSNLYYTDTRVRATVLTGLSTATGGTILGTDTLLQALGKLQNQVTAGGGGTIDSTPTLNSTNAVQSGGVYAALLNKEDKGKGTKTSHGFGIGWAVYKDASGVWQRSTGADNTITSRVEGIVVSVTDANNFILGRKGTKFDTSSLGLAAGTTYYLTTTGTSGINYTSTEPSTIGQIRIVLFQTNLAGEATIVASEPFEIATAASGTLADGDKGDITVSGSGATWTIDNSVITYAKIQNVTATNRLLGRATTGAGVVEEITIGSGLSLSGTTLSATGGSGSGTVNSGTINQLAYYAAGGTTVSTSGANLTWNGTSLGLYNSSLTVYTSATANDSLKVVSNSTGASFGIQNSNASGFAGIEYIDNSGAVRVFTGFNNTNGQEFRFNNIATGGYINLMIGGASALKINNDKTLTLGVAPATYSTGGYDVLVRNQTTGNVEKTTVSGSGSGTVNSGGLNQMAYYAAAGTAVSGLSQWTWDATNVRSTISASSGADIGFIVHNDGTGVNDTPSIRLELGATSKWATMFMSTPASSFGESTGYFTNTANGYVWLTWNGVMNNAMKIKLDGTISFMGDAVDTHSLLSYNANTNDYKGFNIKNTNTGTSASSEYILTADNGSTSTNFGVFGINNSTYSNVSYTIMSPLSTYLFSNGGDLIVGTQSAKDIIFHSGGTLTANERFRISSAGVISIKGFTSAGFVKTSAAGVLSVDTSVYLTSTDLNGTVNRVAKFDATNSIGDSSITDTGTAVSFSTQYGNSVNTVSYAATTVIDWNTSNVAKVTVTAAITTLTLNNPVAGRRYILMITQSGGSFTVAWPASFKWAGGVAPTLSASGKTDIVTLLYDGTNYFAGVNLNF